MTYLKKIAEQPFQHSMNNKWRRNPQLFLKLSISLDSRLFNKPFNSIELLNYRHILEVRLSNVLVFSFLKLGLTRCKVEQPLKGMELQEAQKD